MKTRSRFQRFICILIAGETIILTLEFVVGFADFLHFCFGLLYFFGLVCFQRLKSINSEKIFVFYSFRFMPAQLTRFGIDRNSAILSFAWRVILLSNFFLLQRRFFFRTTVLLGGRSVKKLTELYDFTN